MEKEIESFAYDSSLLYKIQKINCCYVLRTQFSNHFILKYTGRTQHTGLPLSTGEGTRALSQHSILRRGGEPSSCDSVTDCSIHTLTGVLLALIAPAPTAGCTFLSAPKALREACRPTLQTTNLQRGGPATQSPLLATLSRSPPGPCPRDQRQG